MAGRHSPRHARTRGSNTALEQGSSEERLRALSAGLPGLRADLVRAVAHERAHRVVRRAPFVVVAVVVVLLAAVQWFRPLPSPAFHRALPATIRLAGTAPQLPWPAKASAALAVDGGGAIGQSGTTTPVPIAGLAKVMTAYVVVQDHPLAVGADGPAVPVTADAVSTYNAEKAAGESAVPLAAGESLSELQALEGLLVASGNDMATLLASWDAGSSQAFVAKMNSAAKKLGLSHTTYTDPVGLDAGTVGTPQDMVRLGEAVLRVPVLRQVVAMTRATLPLAGVVFNLDADLGHGGIIGIKTGSDTVAGGCFLFAAQQSVAGSPVTVVGAVMGERSGTPTASALSDALVLVRAAFATLGTQSVVAAGTVVGHVTAPWTTSVAVVEPNALTIVGWPGESVPVRIVVRRPDAASRAGARVGTLELLTGGPVVSAPLEVPHALPGAGPVWRLTRL